MTFEENMEAKRQAFEAEQLRWNMYFMNNNNIGLDFLNDMAKALKAGFIDHDDASLCLMGLRARMAELDKLIEGKRAVSVQGRMDNWREKQK